MATENKTPVQTTQSALFNKLCSISLSSSTDKDSSLEMDIKIENERNNNIADEWRQKAENELNETAEIRKSCIKQLRHKLIVTVLKSTTPTTTITENLIPNGRRDDAFLLRFLRAKKFDVEKAFKMIKKYYSMKEQSPELFKVSPASQLHDLLKMQIQYMIPNRDSNGRKLYIFRVKKCDPYKCAVETVFRTNVLALENAVREPETQICGLVVLLDMAGAGIGHAKFLAPYLAKKTVEVVQEAFPLRFKAFHILHEPFYFDAILAILKPFLKEKIRCRIFTHGSNLSSLHKYISPDMLPSEYGGTLSKFDNTLWRESLMNDEQYFQRLENFNYDYSNLLEDSGIEVENIEEINGNNLSLNKDDDDDKTMITMTTSTTADTEVISPINSIVSEAYNDVMNIAAAAAAVTTLTGIPLNENNQKINNSLHTSTTTYSSDDAESDYELCDDFADSQVTEKSKESDVINKEQFKHENSNGNVINEQV